jgi:hypothetical protein
MSAKSKLLFLILLLSGFRVFAQEISIQNPGGSLIFCDDENQIKIRIAGYDSSKVIAYCSNIHIMEGEHGNYQINAKKLKIGEVVNLHIYLEKADGNYLLGERSFSVARKNDFETALGNFRNGDFISVKQLNELSEVQVLDNAVQIGWSYKIITQTCSLKFQNGESAIFLLSGNTISTELKAEFQKLKPGDQVTFYNIALMNGQRSSKTGSNLVFTIADSELNEVRELKNRTFKTKDDLSKIETLSIESFESLTASDENKIISYSIAFVPKKSNAEFMQSGSNSFSEEIKERIRTTLKTGDKVILDQIVFMRKDGSKGKCPAVVIVVL